MNITELQLIKFGKFSDYTIKIEEGFNILYGENEAGKSTLLLFIKTMLYGLSSKRGKSGEIKDRNRVIPWNEDRAAGRVKLRTEGRNIEIYREFRKRSSNDVLRVTDSDTGEELTSFSGEPGEIMLGMSESMFERTLFIAQDDVCMRGKDDEITARLMNLLSTGTATDVSVSGVRERLEKKELSLKARTKRNVKGEIDLLEQERDSLLSQLSSASAAAEIKQSKKKELEALNARIAEITVENDKLAGIRKSQLAEEKIKRVKQLENCLKREMQLANTHLFQVFKRRDDASVIEGMRSDREAIDKMDVKAYELSEKLSEEKSILSKHKDKIVSRMIMVVAPLVLSAIAFIICFVLNRAVIGVGVLAAGISCFAIYLHRYTILKKKISVIEQEIKIKSGELDELRHRISDTEERVSGVLKSFECENYAEFSEKYGIYSEDKAKIKVCRDFYNDTLGDDDYTVLKAEADALKRDLIGGDKYLDIDIEAELGVLNEEKNQAIAAAAKIKQELEINSDMPPYSQIRADIEEIDEVLAEKRLELSAVRLAYECVNEAYSSIKSNFTPRLNRETEKLLEKMTDGRHGNIKVAEDFSLKLNESGDSGELRQAEFFSMGTYNQIYFALRLAIARLTVPAEKRALFIDDLLMTYDDKRAERAVNMLYEMCDEEKMQIIMFSCHKRDYEYVKKIGKDLNIITIV